MRVCQDQLNSIPSINFARSVSPTIISFIASPKTARDAWKTLAITFVEPSRLQWPYSANHRSTYQHRQSIKLVLMKAPVNEEDLIVKVLDGLGDEYENMASAVDARESPITLDELHEKLIDFEVHPKHEAEKNHTPAIVKC